MKKGLIYLSQNKLWEIDLDECWFSLWLFSFKWSVKTNDLLYFYVEVVQNTS